MIKGIVVFVFLICGTGFLDAQGFDDQIYQAYVAGDIDRWERILNEFSPEKPGSCDPYAYLMAQYGFIGHCIDRDQKQRAKPYLESADDMTNELIRKDPENPKLFALRGALFGFRMGYQPQLILLLGPKSLKALDLGLEKGPECPEVWIEIGNKDWYMPEIFGGSKINAISDYEKAIRIMDEDPAYVSHNWYYLYVHRILAERYEERGRTFAAKELCRKVLAIEPGMSWAIEKLSQ